MATQLLHVGSGGKVAAPVGVRVTGVGQEVVLLGGPGDLGGLQGPEVAGGGGVEDVHAGLRLSHGLDQPVQVEEPGVGSLVVEVHAHGEPAQYHCMHRCTAHSF